MDFVERLSVLAAAVAFVFAMHSAGVFKAWDSPAVVGSLVAFCALLASFVLNKWQMEDRGTIQGNLLKKKPFVANLVFVFAFFLVALYCSTLYILPSNFSPPRHFRLRSHGCWSYRRDPPALL